MASVFLSHCSNDKSFARRLAFDLKRSGVHIWIDEAEIQIGDSLIDKLEDGIDSMDFLAVILSPDAVASSWVRKEVEIALNHEIKGRQVKVLPILLHDCQIPGFLLGKVYADFRDEAAYERGLDSILKRLGIKKAAPLEFDILMPKVRHAYMGLSGSEPIFTLLAWPPSLQAEAGKLNSVRDASEIADQLKILGLKYDEFFPSECLIMEEPSGTGQIVKQIFFDNGALAIAESVETLPGTNNICIPEFLSQLKENFVRLRNLVSSGYLNLPFTLMLGIENGGEYTDARMMFSPPKVNPFSFPSLEDSYHKSYGDSSIGYPFQHQHQVWSNPIQIKNKQSNFIDDVKPLVNSFWCKATGQVDFRERIYAIDQSLCEATRLNKNDKEALQKYLYFGHTTFYLMGLSTDLRLFSTWDSDVIAF